MKTINTYINEKLRLSAKPQYMCQPQSLKELRRIILQRIDDDGPNCDLNDIDVSKITSMEYLFDGCKVFNGDISQWDVSNVKDMFSMFYGCKKFNCDLSMWNVSNVEDIRWMLYDCKKFNQDLNSWDVSNVKEMNYAFENCPTKPKWYDKR